MDQSSAMTDFTDKARAAAEAMRAVFPETPLLRNAFINDPHFTIRNSEMCGRIAKDTAAMCIGLTAQAVFVIRLTETNTRTGAAAAIGINPARNDRKPRKAAAATTMATPTIYPAWASSRL